MAGNRCGACGQELESDNLLRIHLYRNDTCRDTLLERLESRAVEALAEALAENVADVRRFGEEHAPDDMVPWLKAEIEVRGPGGRSQMLELLYKDTKLAELPEEDSMVLGVISYSDSTYASGNRRLQAWPMLMGLVNVPEELRWREPGHALVGVLPFPPEWASATEKTRVYQEAYRIVMGPLMRESRE
ncbi:unnamed protein product [Closterium sp. Naga37s-1]|nr:unnamed protein product [Closterium sp. Naga37s-1]